MKVKDIYHIIKGNAISVQWFNEEAVRFYEEGLHNGTFEKYAERDVVRAETAEARDGKPYIRIVVRNP